MSHFKLWFRLSAQVEAPVEAQVLSKADQRGGVLRLRPQLYLACLSSLNIGARQQEGNAPIKTIADCPWLPGPNRYPWVLVNGKDYLQSPGPWIHFDPSYSSTWGSDKLKEHAQKASQSLRSNPVTPNGNQKKVRHPLHPRFTLASQTQSPYMSPVDPFWVI